MSTQSNEIEPVNVEDFGSGEAASTAAGGGGCLPGARKGSGLRLSSAWISHAFSFSASASGLEKRSENKLYRDFVRVEREWHTLIHRKRHVDDKSIGALEAVGDDCKGSGQQCSSG